MKKYKFITWVGGIPNYHYQKIDALIDFNDWKSKGYDDVQIEKIQL